MRTFCSWLTSQRYLTKCPLRVRCFFVKQYWFYSPNYNSLNHHEDDFEIVLQRYKYLSVLPRKTSLILINAKAFKYIPHVAKAPLLGDDSKKVKRGWDRWHSEPPARTESPQAPPHCKCVAISNISHWQKDLTAGVGTEAWLLFTHLYLHHPPPHQHHHDHCQIGSKAGTVSNTVNFAFQCYKKLKCCVVCDHQCYTHAFVSVY